jgi:hypothetical protein
MPEALDDGETTDTDGDDESADDSGDEPGDEPVN